MKNEDILNEIKKLGNWTAHNIWIKDDIYTRKKGEGCHRSRRFVQIICDYLNKPFQQLRILDLACLEGLHAIEFARLGAAVVGIEGREENIKKARFVKEVLLLNNLDFFLDDVRNLSVEKYGEFDVVLCSGILYHLDTPDVFHFIKRIFEVCKKLLIVDTYIDIHNNWDHQVKYEFDGKNYLGRYDFEHNPSSTKEEKLNKLWYSLDNVRSFKFTRSSLYNILSHTGFTSLYECHNPPCLINGVDKRITLLAVKGKPSVLISYPDLNNKVIPDHPEDDENIEWQKFFIRLEEVKNSIIKRFEGKKLIIYGAGSASKSLFQDLRKKLQIVAFIDRNEELNNTKFAGEIDIQPPENLKDMDFDSILITPIKQQKDIVKLLHENVKDFKNKDILFIEDILCKPVKKVNQKSSMISQNYNSNRKRIVLTILDSFAYWIFKRFIDTYPDSFIAKMAREGLNFTNNYSTCSYSFPSYPSILFGVYPYEHKILGRFGFKIADDDSLKSIHDCLIQKGWDVSTYSEEEWIFKKSGYGYDCNPRGDAFNFDIKSPYHDNTFIFLNYWGTHYPWSLTKPYDFKILPSHHEITKAFKEGDTATVSKIRENWLSRCFKNIALYSERLSHLDDGKTYIILTGDHGEDIYYHGLDGSALHGGPPWDTVQKVPLVIYPYPKPEVTNKLCSSIYIKQMILDLSESTGSPNISFNEPTEVHVTGGNDRVTVHMHTIEVVGFVFNNGIKYFIEGRFRGEPVEHLYNLKEDKEEKSNLINTSNDRSEVLKFWSDKSEHQKGFLRLHYPYIWNSDLFKTFMNNHRMHQKDEEEKIKEKLHALGYI
jgi:2-polyprenyl-3-methyl-5-hydroxy-6-metoxy-1,4-benzoquinol methylase